MTKDVKKTKRELEVEQALTEITNDLQRTRADFENYRKRIEAEKQAARDAGRSSAIFSLLPIIDNIDRAIRYVPADLQENQWAQGVVGLQKNMDKMLTSLGLTRINAQPGTVFNPDLHDAIQMDEDSVGKQEVIAEELQPGYMLGDSPIRHAMVRVTRK